MRPARDSRTTTSSAYPPNVASVVVPATRSPTFSDVTPSPTASTTPDGSTPGISGSVTSMPEAPATSCTSSVVLTETACTRMSTSPGPGVGSWTSSRCSCSGPPNALTTIAFIRSPRNRVHLWRRGQPSPPALLSIDSGLISSTTSWRRRGWSALASGGIAGRSWRRKGRGQASTRAVVVVGSGMGSPCSRISSRW